MKKSKFELLKLKAQEIKNKESLKEIKGGARTEIDVIIGDDIDIR